MEHPRELVGKTYFVKTFGCQMNLHDSERVAGVLDECGCICVSDPDDADIVVFMTCCVREKADQHLYGQASAMVSAPVPPSGRRVVAIGGCIAQRDGEKIRAPTPSPATAPVRRWTRSRTVAPSRPSCRATGRAPSTPGFPS